jgi:hypothetical protein
MSNSSKSSDNSKSSTKSKSSNEISDNFKEKVLTYVKIDDLIRKKQEEIKELKVKKIDTEEYILNSLNNYESDYINIPGGKLIKNISEVKAPLKIDIIKESILEGIKKEKVTQSEEVNKKIIDNIINLMDVKRGKLNKIKLKRTFEKKKKQINKKK